MEKHLEVSWIPGAWVWNQVSTLPSTPQEGPCHSSPWGKDSADTAAHPEPVSTLLQLRDPITPFQKPFGGLIPALIAMEGHLHYLIPTL